MAFKSLKTKNRKTKMLNACLSIRNQAGKSKFVSAKEFGGLEEVEVRGAPKVFRKRHKDEVKFVNNMYIYTWAWGLSSVGSIFRPVG